MKDLIIVGSGNAAREYLQIAKDVNKVSPTWRIKGFISDYGVDVNKLTNGEYQLLGSIREWVPSDNEVFVCSISEPTGKKSVVESLLSRGAVFVDLLHPTARIGDYVQKGLGLVMYPYASIGVNSNVGNFVTVSGSIAHDNDIGDYVTLSGGAALSGNVTVGECAFFGAKSVVAPKVKIGNNAFIGIGSVVVSNVKPNVRVFGNPARKIDF